MTDKILEDFRSEIKDFLSRHNMSKTTFSRYAAQSPSFYDRIMADDAVVNTSTMQRVRGFMHGFYVGLEDAAREKNVG